MRVARARSGGFTLVEAMIAMVIAAIFIVSSSMLVSSIGGETGRNELKQRLRDDVRVALDLLRNDIEMAGTGMPFDVATKDPFFDLPDLESDLEAMSVHSIYDIDRNNGADELFLGGVALQSGWVGSVASVVVGSGAGFVDIARLDGPALPVTYVNGGCNSMGDPYVPGAVCGQPGPLFFNLMGSNGWVYQDPLQVETVTKAPAPAVETLRISYTDPGPRLGKSVAVGQVMNFYRRAYNGGVAVSPRSIPVARWYLDQPGGAGTSGNLMRELRFVSPGNGPLDPPTAISVGNREVILKNVVDFQTSFLVWRCNSGPEWVNHLFDESASPSGAGEFDAGGTGNYVATANAEGRAQRYMAMRERLLSVRTSFLLRTDARKVGDDMTFASGAVADLQLDNHVNGAATLDSTSEYFSTQYSFDPLNLRIKTTEGSIFPYPPVRDSGTDVQFLMGGVCRGQRS